MDKVLIKELERRAKEIRYLILKTAHEAGAGHVGGSLSMTEIMTALYFNVMTIDPENPAMEERDRFILSKGHASPGYYSTLASRGYFPEEELATFDRVDSRLQAHPDMNKCPGVDYSAGSLGQGLSIGLGMARGGRDAGKNFTTFVLMGDGEIQEGQVWEAAMWGGAAKVKGIVGIVDYNKVQLAATTAATLDLEPLADKWRAFGWHVLECEGNDMGRMAETLEEAKSLSSEEPAAVLAHTVKGRGVSFMEGRFQWHGKAPNREEFHKALAELGCADREGS